MPGRSAISLNGPILPEQKTERLLPEISPEGRDIFQNRRISLL
jgi:hypothetical protein